MEIFCAGQNKKNTQKNFFKGLKCKNCKILLSAHSITTNTIAGSFIV